MDSSDFLTRVSTDYHLGNHFDALEAYRDYRQSGVFGKDSTNQLQITLFAHKSMVHAMRDCESQVSAFQSCFTDQLPLLELFLKYYAVTLLPGGETEAEGLMSELVTEDRPNCVTATDFNSVRMNLNNALAFYTGRFSEMRKFDVKLTELNFEFNAFVFLAFEKNNQFGEAERLLDDFRASSDEHVLALVLRVRREMRLGRFEAALGAINEVREKFGDSLRLGSLRAACLLGMLRFGEVSSEGGSAAQQTETKRH